MTTAYLAGFSNNQFRSIDKALQWDCYVDYCRHINIRPGKMYSASDDVGTTVFCENSDKDSHYYYNHYYYHDSNITRHNI